MLIEILARSEHWLAVNKPAGLSVYESSYTGPREETLLGLLRGQLGAGRIRAIHRLDHATSGVLLLALAARTAAVLSGQFESRAVDKRYIAVVRGEPAEQFEVDHPLAGADGKGAVKAALTRFRTLARLRLPIPLARHPEARYALVEAQPETGRYHHQPSVVGSAQLCEIGQWCGITVHAEYAVHDHHLRAVCGSHFFS